MRINRFLAQASGLSRRAADTAIERGEVRVNGAPPTPGYNVMPEDRINFNNQVFEASQILTGSTQTIVLHKPRGYVVSRDGQGSRTIYDLLPSSLHHLKPIGRLDKDSSGILLLTTDGELANRLTHPRYQKIKQYHVKLDRALTPLHRQMIEDYGIRLDDGPSKFQLDRLHDGDDTAWQVTMHEGRNRQIRRTFAALGYTVTGLHRTTFGEYRLNDTLNPGTYILL